MWRPCQRQLRWNTLTSETAFLKCRVRTQVARVRLALGVSRDVQAEFRLVAVRSPAFITDERTNAEMNLGHVLVKTAANNPEQLLITQHNAPQPEHFCSLSTFNYVFHFTSFYVAACTVWFVVFDAFWIGYRVMAPWNYRVIISIIRSTGQAFWVRLVHQTPDIAYQMFKVCICDNYYKQNGK